MTERCDTDRTTQQSKGHTNQQKKEYNFQHNKGIQMYAHHEVIMIQATNDANSRSN